MPQTITYDDVSRREDLLDLITNVDATEDTLMSDFGTSTANNTLHEYLGDTLKSVGDNAQAEGATPTYADRTDPTRMNNKTQIVRVDFQVSGTEDAVNKAGMDTRFAYEMRKAMVEWRNDAEFALMRGSSASGASGTARRLDGVKQCISTVATAQSGVSLNETQLNDYIENTWNVSSGVVDTIYVPSRLKRRISGFTGGATKQVQVEDKKLINTVDVYTSDFGTHNVKLHRYTYQSGDNNYDIVGLQTKYWKVAHLRRPKFEELAKTADAKNGIILGELTLESLAQKANFKATGHL